MLNATLIAELTVLGQVLLIDLLLAGDNAVVVGMAVTGLPAAQRRRAIVWGIAAATAIRIVFAVVAVQLLAIPGLKLAGGLLLFWVCFRMWRDLLAHGTASEPGAAPRTLRAAMLQIILADVSMSLDNVLAVAGAAHDHPWILALGLLLSVLLMGLAATALAKLLERHAWIAWLGLAVVVYVAGELTVDGVREVAPLLHLQLPAFLSG